jgi:hypothetical protein
VGDYRHNYKEKLDLSVLEVGTRYSPYGPSRYSMDDPEQYDYTSETSSVNLENKHQHFKYNEIPADSESMGEWNTFESRYVLPGMNFADHKDLIQVVVEYHDSTYVALETFKVTTLSDIEAYRRVTRLMDTYMAQNEYKNHIVYVKSSTSCYLLNFNVNLENLYLYNSSFQTIETSEIPIVMEPEAAMPEPQQINESVKRWMMPSNYVPHEPIFVTLADRLIPPRYQDVVMQTSYV